MDSFKIFIITFLSLIIAYLDPINNALLVLIIVFVWDILIGILVDLVINKDRIRIKKMLFALIFIALYSIIIASVFVCAKLMGDVDEGLYIIKVITYVCVYFYSSNVLRNLTILFPDNKIFAFLYEFLGLQIMKRLPELSHLLRLGKDKSDKN